MAYSENFLGLNGFIWFVGVVEDRNDPLKAGRVRVRILGTHTEVKEDLPTTDLPWASCLLPTTSAGISGLGEHSFLVEGSWVFGYFKDGMDRQDPMILGSMPGIPVALGETAKGFNDPNGTYPSEKITHSNHSIEEPDVNRLARNDTGYAHAVVAAKNTAKTSTVPTANSSTTWNEPDSAYDASYPKNHVLETESGHIKEYDDTSGQERIHEYHTKGTFYEIDKDGNKSTRIVGDNYEVVAGSDFVNIKGTANLTIDSNCNTYIKGNWNIQVDGTKTEVVTGAVSETYKSTKTENVTGAVQETFSSTQTTNVSSNVTITGSRIDLN